MYYLQQRWKLQNGKLKYYGLRNKSVMFKNTVKLSNAQQGIIKKLPCDLTDFELQKVNKLLGVQIVDAEHIKHTPKSLEEARFCVNCAANDFIIPGLEFDENGLCPMCQTAEETKNLKSVVPVKNTFPRSKKSRFDVAVFYTGGKDSTYLLYYLSKVLNLRVLALTWEIPYMSECAAKSIEGAKRTLGNVEFISRKVADADLKKIYKHLYKIADNTCACPSLAYALFYPELVANKVPYFVAGNESAQLIGLYYNHMAPKIAYSFGNSKILNLLVNVGRLILLHPPLRKGQLHTLETMKQLAYGDNPLKNIFGYSNALVHNVVEAIHQVPEMVKPLKRAIRLSSWSGNIPAFVQVDFNDICGGVYDWRKIKKTIIEECGWVPPEEYDKGLHTSCKIEKCKEYSQFKRFYDMRSDMIPFSALEISLASRDKAVSREEAIAEMKSALGFSLDEIAECAIMKEYIEK
ncbi:MAG: hypothetical protein HDT36_00910 [Clostridiales bacterium]|nr:hypothetical protein [Clostridiales bacterium]